MLGHSQPVNATRPLYMQAMGQGRRHRVVRLTTRVFMHLEPLSDGGVPSWGFRIAGVFDCQAKARS